MIRAASVPQLPDAALEDRVASPFWLTRPWEPATRHWSRDLARAAARDMGRMTREELERLARDLALEIHAEAESADPDPAWLWCLLVQRRHALGRLRRLSRRGGTR
jgi:hypothetical protein